MDVMSFNAVFQEIFIYVILAVVAFGIAVIKKWFSNLGVKQDKMQGCLDAVNARTVRHGNAIIEVGQHLDEESVRFHPDRSPRPLKDRLQRIITDESGNL